MKERFMPGANPFQGHPERTSGVFLKKEAPKVEKREKQLDLVKLWRAEQIKWNPNENGNRLRPEKQDVEDYHRMKRGYRGMGMYGSEGAAFAEYLVLETLGAEGKLKGKHSMSEHAYAYEPSDLDDILRGTDALMMYTELDEEKERILYPVAVDVTLSPEDAKLKQMKDLSRLSGRYVNLAKIYWYDTQSDEPGLSFDEPAEGRIRALNTTVYVPGELADAFVNPKTTAEKAEEIMQSVGRLALDQQRWQLELEALLLTGAIQADRSGGMRVLVRHPTRLQVLRELDSMLKRGNPKDNDATYAAQALRAVLPSVWSSWDEHPLTRHEESMLRGTRLTEDFDRLENDWNENDAAAE